MKKQTYVFRQLQHMIPTCCQQDLKTNLLLLNCDERNMDLENILKQCLKENLLNDEQPSLVKYS